MLYHRFAAIEGSPMYHGAHHRVHFLRIAQLAVEGHMSDRHREPKFLQSYLEAIDTIDQLALDGVPKTGWYICSSDGDGGVRTCNSHKEQQYTWKQRSIFGPRTRRHLAAELSQRHLHWQFDAQR